MPIRINLLAEAQALEELRRKDPVKRAIWCGVGVVVLVLAWSSSLQLKAMISKGELNRLESQVAARTNEYRLVLAHSQNLVQANRKLNALTQLATNRLLYGTLLNAMQQTMTVEDVQLMRFRVEQAYVATAEVKAQTNKTQAVRAKPPTVTEKITLTMEAKDAGVSTGDQVNKYKQAVADCAYFQNVLGKTNDVRLANLSPPGLHNGKPSVLFTLEVRFPERLR